MLISYVAEWRWISARICLYDDGAVHDGRVMGYVTLSARLTARSVL